MYRSVLPVAALLWSAGWVAFAGPITYNVTVNSSSITGTAGSLDFNFNPGPLVTQAASLQILNFTSDGTLAGNCPCGIGDVGGQLPATVTFDNGTAFNDYFDGFTFGSTISFQLSLFGPALSSPDGVSTSGSTFAFSMFSDAAGTIPALTTDTSDGFAFTVDMNLDGSATVTDFSSQTSVAVAASGVPEPSTLALAGAAFALLVAFRLGRLRGWVRNDALFFMAGRDPTWFLDGDPYPKNFHGRGYSNELPGKISREHK